MNPSSDDSSITSLDNPGGTVAGNQAARVDIWRPATEFLASTLRKGGK